MLLNCYLKAEKFIKNKGKLRVNSYIVLFIKNVITNEVLTERVIRLGK